MTIARWRNGFVTPAVGLAYIYGIGGVAIGAAMGAWVFKRIPGAVFRKIVYGFIGISGLIILLRA